MRLLHAQPAQTLHNIVHPLRAAPLAAPALLLPVGACRLVIVPRRRRRARMRVGRIRARRDRELEVLRQIAHVVGRAAGGGGARGRRGWGGSPRAAREASRVPGRRRLRIVGRTRGWWVRRRREVDPALVAVRARSVIGVRGDGGFAGGRGKRVARDGGVGQATPDRLVCRREGCQERGDNDWARDCGLLLLRLGGGAEDKLGGHVRTERTHEFGHFLAPIHHKGRCHGGDRECGGERGRDAGRAWGCEADQEEGTRDVGVR